MIFFVVFVCYALVKASEGALDKFKPLSCHVAKSVLPYILYPRMGEEMVRPTEDLETEERSLKVVQRFVDSDWRQAYRGNFLVSPEGHKPAQSGR